MQLPRPRILVPAAAVVATLLYWGVGNQGIGPSGSGTAPAVIVQNNAAAQWPAGAAAYASYTALPLTDGATSMTFATRLRVPTTWPVSEQTIFHRDSASSIQRHLMVNLGPSRNLVIYIASTLTGAWTTCTTAASSLSVDTTYQIVVAFDGGQTGDAARLRVYANTIQQTCTFSGSVPAAMTIPTTAVWTIGATFSGLTSLRSAILDDIAYWSGIPAAPAQVTELYNSGQPFDPRVTSSMGPPIAYWNFESSNINETGVLGAPVATTNTGAITFTGSLAYQSTAPTQPSNPGCGVAQVANTQRQLVWSVNENGTVRVRGAYLSVPQDYDSSRRYPVEEMFHGCSFTGSGLRADVNGPDIETQAYRGVVSLYPDGLAEVTCIPSNATGWDLTASSHDLYFFDSITRAMRAQICFDETQLLVGGRSMGGGFAQVLAGSRPSAIAKIATVSTAIAPLATPSAKWMYIGHNTNDPTVNVSVARAARDAWITANGCSSPVTSVWNANCTAYTCTRAPLLYCEWAGGGHTPDAANAGLIWQHWAWPGPLDAPQRLGPLANDTGNAFSGTGDSTMFGSLSTAVTTTPPFANNYRSATTWPFWAIREGTASGGGGNNVEAPITAAATEQRALRHASLGSKGFIGSNHSGSGYHYDYLRKGSVLSNVYVDMYGSPSGDLYTSRAARLGAGLPYRMTGMVVRTGHNDDDQGMCTSFFSNYRQLQQDADADARALTGQSHNVPLYWLQFSSWQMGGVMDTAGTCATELERLTATYPTTQVLCAPSYHLGSGATSIYNADGIHFSGTGYILAGEYLGLCKHAVEDAGQPWAPLIPRSVTIATPNTIDVDYTGRIPCQRLNSTNTGTTACDTTDCCTGSGSFLTFDTTNVVTPATGDQANALQYGFELSCPSARPPVMTSVAITGSPATHVTITTDKNIPTGCSVSYARTAVAGSYAGNGTAATGYSAPRGQLRDTMAITGRLSGQTLYTWGATWIRSLAGGVAPQPSSSATFEEDNFDFLYVPTSTKPAAASAWPDRRGGYAIPYGAGTWTIGSRAASLGADAVADYSWIPTNAYFRQTGGANHQFDAITQTDVWFRWAGTCARPAANGYLLHYYGGVNNEYYVQIVSNGNTLAFWDGTSGGGSALSYNRAGLWPATPVQCLLDIYWEARGGTNGTGRTTICLNGACATQAAGGVLGDVTTGDLTINAFRTGSSPYASPSYGFGLAYGNRARQAWGHAGNYAKHTAAYDRFCPPANRPCL